MDLIQACHGVQNTAADPVLFILDDSTSMQSSLSGDGRNRWEAAVDVFNAVLNNLDDGVPVGLMTFAQGGDGNIGSTVKFPVMPLGDTIPTGSEWVLHPTSTGGASWTVRDELLNIIATNSIENSGTPTQDAMAEGIRYALGKNVVIGRDRNGDGDGELSHPASYTMPASYSVEPPNCHYVVDSSCAGEQISPAAGTAAEYTSPLAAGGVLQSDGYDKLHIILILDGNADGAEDVDDIEAFIGTSCSGSSEEECLRELADYIGADPQLKLSIVGIDLDSDGRDLLDDMSARGGGGGETYYASDTDTLTSMINDAVNSTSVTNYDKDAINFAGAGRNINADNPIFHDSDVYYPVFQPATGPMWGGNLKRYDISGDPLVPRGKNDVAARDASDGSFNEAVQSFWTTGTTPDGNDAIAGGAASQLDGLASSRFLFTNVNIGESPSHPSNNLIPSNSNIAPYFVNGNRATLINWLRGAQPDVSHGHMAPPCFLDQL